MKHEYQLVQSLATNNKLGHVNAENKTRNI